MAGALSLQVGGGSCVVLISNPRTNKQKLFCADLNKTKRYQKKEKEEEREKKGGGGWGLRAEKKEGEKKKKE